MTPFKLISGIISSIIYLSPATAETADPKSLNLTGNNHLQQEQDFLNQCLLQKLQTAQDSQTVGEIRQACHNQALQNGNMTPSYTAQQDVITQRLASESSAESNQFLLSSYKPNYLLFATYNENINTEQWRSAFSEGEMDHQEVKLQLSFKARIAKGVLGGDLWGAYTQQSWWQLYNDEVSSPFRETNYEPEIFLRWNTDFDVLGFQNRELKFGFNHESNGRSQLLSRSWNRFVAGTTLEKGRFIIEGRAWYRIPEASEDDDNPDILKYTGYGDIKTSYTLNRQVVAMTLTNNLRRDNKSSIQLDWTFPLGDRFKGYLHYYYGYGESLIDYNISTNRIGFGVLLNDWQ